MRYIGVAVLAVLVLGGTGWAWVDYNDRIDQPALAADPTPTPTIEPDLPPEPGDFADFQQLVADVEQPVIVSILGDSTGNGSDEWVYGAFTRIAEEAGRPLTIHTWSQTRPRYEPPATFGDDRGGAPMVVWNGSASGRDADYSLEHLSKMQPEQPDLVIISHGHNQTGPTQGARDVLELMDAALSPWAETPAFAVTLQNPRLVNAEVQEDVVDRLEELVSSLPGVVTINAHAAFEDAGNVRRLLNPDELHPNVEGQQVWAEAAYTVLAG